MLRVVEALVLPGLLMLLVPAACSAEVIVLGAEGVRVAGEVAVLEVEPEGAVRVDLLVSLADDSPREQDLHLVITLSQPPIGETDDGYLPVDEFGQQHVDQLTNRFYQVLAARRHRAAAAVTASVAGGFLGGPVSALATLHQSRHGVGRVRAYGRLGAMPSEGVRFRSMQVQWRDELRVEEIAAFPSLPPLEPAERDALKRYEGQPYVLIRARTKRNWRDLQGGAALWAEGIWLGFTQEMRVGEAGEQQYGYVLDTSSDSSGRSHSQVVFVTAADSVPLTVDFPARPRTKDLPAYEKQMAYADESATWGWNGRQVHMARYDRQAPEGTVEIQLREGEPADLAGRSGAEARRVGEAWVVLSLLGALIWCLAFLAIGRRSALAQELGFWRGMWRTWWVAHALVLGPALFFAWTVAAVFDWRLRSLLAEQQVSWEHIVYGLSVLVPVGLAIWSPLVISRFRARREGRFLLWALATALAAGLAYIHSAQIATGWLIG